MIIHHETATDKCTRWGAYAIHWGIFICIGQYNTASYFQYNKEKILYIKYPCDRLQALFNRFHQPPNSSLLHKHNMVFYSCTFLQYS